MLPNIFVPPLILKDPDPTLRTWPPSAKESGAAGGTFSHPIPQDPAVCLDAAQEGLDEILAVQCDLIADGAGGGEPPAPSTALGF
jgi:hypothetical protein